MYIYVKYILIIRETLVISVPPESSTEAERIKD